MMRLPGLALSPSEQRTVLLLVLLLLANLAVGYLVWQERDRHEQLWKDEGAARAGWENAQRTLNVDELKKELERLQRRLSSQGVAFPRTVQDIALADHIIQSATRTGIQLLRLDTVGPPSEKLGERPYRTLRFFVRARGAYAQLASFIGALQKDFGAPLALPDFAFVAEPQGWLASFHLVAFAQP